MVYEARTKPTDVSVADFIAAVKNPQRRADAEILCALFEEISGEPPVMWGPLIVGFGRYHYRYDSGHEGDAGRIGFSPRKGALRAVRMVGGDDAEAVSGLAGALRGQQGGALGGGQVAPAALGQVAEGQGADADAL